MAEGKGIASIGLVALAGGLIVLALLLTGGPLYARKEWRDQDRLGAIGAIWTHASCQARQGAGLPEKLSAMPPCGEAPKMQDRLGVPYTYTRVSPTEARVCATFELSLPQDSAFGGVATPGQPGCWDFVIARRDSADPAIGSDVPYSD